MLDLGYEVWFHNARGLKYSDKRDGQENMELTEYWDFNWADMGFYDLPVSIDKVLEISGANKLTLIGHSQGVSQTWYSMAHK